METHLYEQMQRLASADPALRPHLVPLLRKFADQRIEVGKTILKQMGGMRRIIAMTGAKNFMWLNLSHYGMGGVKFDFPNRGRGKPNSVSIWLTPEDTYTVRFARTRGVSYKILKEVEGIYAGQLKSLFERETGLYLSL